MQIVLRHPATALQVPYHSFYTRTRPKPFALLLFHVSAVRLFRFARHQDCYSLNFLPAFASTVVYDLLRQALAVAFHLFQKRFYRVAVVGIIAKRFNRSDYFPPRIASYDYSYLVAKLVLLMRFAFADTLFRPRGFPSASTKGSQPLNGWGCRAGLRLNTMG